MRRLEYVGNVAAKRATTHRQRLRRFALAALAVPILVLALVAMHAIAGMSSEMDGIAHYSQPATTASMAVAVEEPGGASQRDAHSCESDCPPLGHDMIAMSCILALMATALVFATRMTLVRLRPFAQSARIEVRATAVAPRRPPSIFTLSIVRI